MGSLGSGSGSGFFVIGLAVAFVLLIGGAIAAVVVFAKKSDNPDERLPSNRLAATNPTVSGFTSSRRY